MRAARSCRRADRTVTPLLTSPERTSMRRRGTAHTHRPSRSASTSMVCSRPPASVCTTISPSSGRRTAAVSSSASRTMPTPMPALPNRGLAMSGKAQAPGSASTVSGVAWRTVGKPLATSQSWVSCLSAAMSTTPPPDSEIVVPMAANWSRLPTHAAISVSIVGTSRSTACFSHTSSSVGTNAGSSSRGTMMPSSDSWNALEYHVASVAMTRPSRPSDASARRKPRSSSTRRPADDTRTVTGRPRSVAGPSGRAPVTGRPRPGRCRSRGTRGGSAWPSWLMPSRLATLRTVATMISMSRRSERFSTYQTSMSSWSSQVRALRPLACAHPVMPGRTSWRRAWAGE